MRSMKKYCILLSELWLCAFFLLTGCAGTKGAEEKKSIRIGVSLYRGDDTFLNNIRGELERCAKDFEQEKGVKVTLDIQDAKGNQNTQNDQVERFLALGCDVLCINPVDRTAASVLIDKAMAAQTPVIFFNRQPVAEDINYRGRVFYVGASAEESGRLQGELVAQAWKEEGLDRNGDGVLQYVMLEGEPGHQDSLLRTEYSIEAVTGAGIEVEKLANAPANWNRGQGAARMNQWIKEYGERIEVVFSNNDDMALGAIDALREWGGPMPLVVGVDATAPAREAVAAGDLYGTVLNDARGQAQAMVDLALALADGRDPGGVVELQEGHYVWLPYRRVDRDNLEEIVRELEG